MKVVCYTYPLSQHMCKLVWTFNNNRVVSLLSHIHSNGLKTSVVLLVGCRDRQL